MRQPRLALLFSGGALNAIGTWATLIALWGFAAYRFHSGPEQIAILGLAWSLPGAVVSLFSGWPIDRFGPRPTIVASNVLGMVTALAMAASHSYSTLLLLTLAAGGVQAFGRPAAMSLPPRLVDDRDLLEANALMNMAEQSAMIFGPLVASLAISWWGLKAAFLVDAATFVAGTAAVLPLRLREVTAPDEGASSARDLLAGLRLARHRPEVRRTLTMAFFVFASWGAFMVMEPLYVRDVLHRSPATLGYLQTVFGVGLLGMTALLPRLGDRVATVRALALAVMASGGAAALYVGTRWLVVAAAGVFAWGVITGFFLPPMQTLLQRATPPETHGRVMAVAGTLDGIGGLVSVPLTGLVVGALGVSGTGLVVGAILAVAGLAGLARAGAGTGPAVSIDSTDPDRVPAGTAR